MGRISKAALAAAIIPAENLRTEHQVYIQALTAGMNGADAYAEAYPAAGPNSLWGGHYRLQKNPVIRAEVQRIRRERMQRRGVDAERVMEAQAAIAFHNVADFEVWKDGKKFVTDSDKLDRRLMLAVKRVKQTENGIELEYYDRAEALRFLGLEAGLGVEKKVVEVRVAGSLDSVAAKILAEMQAREIQAAAVDAEVVSEDAR